MVTPSFSTLLVSGALLLIALAANWYLWGRAYTADYRAPRPVRPIGGAELLDRFLGRAVATSQAVLPAEIIESANAATAKAKATTTAKEHERHGFRNVA
ncbi:hypothetical protein IMX07_01755 [bacterium]|nr:hypothetical protein [bacterium]